MKYKIILFSLFLTILHPCTSQAQNYERISEYESNLYGESIYINGDYETMKSVRAYWVRECNKLKNQNCEFVLCGNAEAVLRVTIPARILFHANDTVLANGADNIIRPLIKFLIGEEALATCIVACFSDNNGSDKYLSSLTTARAASIYQWLKKQGIPESSLSYYGLGTKVNRTNNDNIKNRELNRRVSLYLVPNKKMLKLAKKGKL